MNAEKIIEDTKPYFKRTIIQKRMMSDFAEFDAIRFRFDAIKNIGLLSRQEAKINFNAEPVNEEISKIAILDYY